MNDQKEIMKCLKILIFRMSIQMNKVEENLNNKSNMKIKQELMLIVGHNDDYLFIDNKD